MLKLRLALASAHSDSVYCETLCTYILTEAAEQKKTHTQNKIQRFKLYFDILYIT